MKTGKEFTMLTLAIILSIVMIDISQAQTAAKKEAAYPKPPFAMKKATAEGILPFGGNRFTASCKEGYEFLIVATTELQKGKEVPSSEIEWVIIDQSGTEYHPVAFGLPSKVSKEPFLIIGYSFNGDIMIVDVDKTIMGLFFLVPKQAKMFSIKKAQGPSAKLMLLKDFSPPDSVRIEGYKSNGRVDFGTPTIKENGWGLK